MTNGNLLEFDDCTVEELHITPNAAHRQAGELPQPRVEVDFQVFVHRAEQNRFAVSLSIKSEEPVTEEHPLRFSIRVVGFFRVTEPMVDGKVHPDRAVNGLTLLYGMARGHIGTAAAWFGHPIMLPTVYFTDRVNAKIEETRKRELAEEPPLIEAATA